MSNRLRELSEPRESVAMTAIQGAISGGLGTVPMTAAMAVLHRLLPARQQYELPPRMIVEDLSEDAGLDGELSSDELESLTWASHFGYGALAGMAYGLIARRTPLKGIGGGMAFGLAVWGASYLGWLPAFNMRASATKEPAERSALMIAAHLIWGGATGYLQDAQQQIADR